jgi:hypothetical protein
MWGREVNSWKDGDEKKLGQYPSHLWTLEFLFMGGAKAHGDIEKREEVSQVPSFKLLLDNQRVCCDFRC